MCHYVILSRALPACSFICYHLSCVHAVSLFGTSFGLVSFSFPSTELCPHSFTSYRLRTPAKNQCRIVKLALPSNKFAEKINFCCIDCFRAVFSLWIITVVVFIWLLISFDIHLSVLPLFSWLLQVLSKCSCFFLKKFNLVFLTAKWTAPPSRELHTPMKNLTILWR